MQFEYRTLVIKGTAWASKVEQRGKQLDDALNPLGAMGWELVSVVPYGQYLQATLKRAR